MGKRISFKAMNEQEGALLKYLKKELKDFTEDEDNEFKERA